MSGVLRIILNIYVGCICHSICFVACMESPQSRCRHKATSIYWWVPVVVMGSNIMFVLLCWGQNTNRCKYSSESINRLWEMAVNIENTLVLFTFPFLLNMQKGSMFSHWGWMIHKHHYNMTVWHFGPCVTFWPCLCDISARLVWHFGPLVRNEGKRVSPYPHINHWRRL